MEIIKTTDYFNKSIEDLSQIRNTDWTREECLIEDSGLVTYYFSKLETLKEDFTAIQEYAKNKKYDEIIVLEMLVKNTNNNKYVVILR